MVIQLSKDAFAAATSAEPELDPLSGAVTGVGPLLLSQTVVESGDAAAGTSTNARVSVGDRFDGNLSSFNDRDWIAIDLVAGQSYVFTAFGRGGSSSGLTDPVLRVVGPSGQQVAYSDDVYAASGYLLSYFPEVGFTARTTGTHYIEVSGYSGSGRYTVSTATNVFTPEQIASYLVESSWGVPSPLTFGRTSLTYNIDGLTAAGRQLAEWAFDVWGTTTGLVFTRTSSGSADIRLEDNESGAFAGPYSYNPLTGQINYSTVNIESGWLSVYGTSFDSYSYQTYLHEIGHALGLGHAGPYDGSASFARDALYLNDSYQLTIMSYFDVESNPNVTGANGLPLTPMIADLEAIEMLYGSIAANTGDTVWGRGSNVGGVLGQLMAVIAGERAAPAGFLAGDPILLTISDTGGNDLLDVGFSTAHQRIDLRPGTLSDIDGERNNVAISLDSVIERVISGRGNDSITAHDFGAHITGGGGNDTIIGGAGTDTVRIASRRDAATVQRDGDWVVITSADGIDRIRNVEFFQFNDRTLALTDLFATTPTPTPEPTPGGVRLDGTSGNDTLQGGAGPDLIYGHGGNDRLVGNAGNDTIYGGDGNDNIIAGAGDDLVYGGAGNDNIAGAAGNDTIYGGDGNDSLGGGDGNDRLFGGAGRDVIGGGGGEDHIEGGDGDDLMSGGAGRDTLYGGDGNDQIGGSFDDDLVYGGNGHDDLGGGDGADTIYGGAGNDSVGGGGGNDLIYGEEGDDFLAGGAGNDTIYGGPGADRINGGPGNDVLYGGFGPDRFIFNALTRGENDRVMDFQDGLDRLQISGLTGNGAERFAQISITQIGADVLLDVLGHRITLVDMRVGQIDQSDFIWV
ncbi:M10 family metallopeptidase C-terminal domain-containing protein [Pseudogemmobacter sonorensis]|uniref:M10 family metallopeptidase n=1 Tax=Pseudogemmobacter sonorensis TaxID=2989681 RepID=UPI0036954FD1